MTNGSTRKIVGIAFALAVLIAAGQMGGVLGPTSAANETIEGGRTDAALPGVGPPTRRGGARSRGRGNALGPAARRANAAAPLRPVALGARAVERHLRGLPSLLAGGDEGQPDDEGRRVPGR